MTTTTADSSSISPALSPGNVAVVTGAASGIGLAAARRFAGLGMKVVLADRNVEALAKAADEVAAQASGGGAQIMTVATDVGDRSSLHALDEQVRKAWGRVHLLMNNAGIQPGSALFSPQENWDAVLRVNLGGVIDGTRIFVPHMIEHGEPALVINTGSKQGITTPPGDPAYNVAKSGVKTFTEALQHELRNLDNCRVTAHLLIPGFVFTPLAAGGRTEKPDGAWTPEQTVDFMLQKLGEGDFYILCPDNDVPRQLDEKRIRWAADDILLNRPPLSRWHKDYAEAFKAFVEE
ncbi:SDR family NAD(P)-dependent oxidoreductase [Phyllobacterium salinisoli]|uniref:SDR family NAD(P)-dependent oxidoreductase n=1 Tax=Phyllobacterium salinisoli TaxID=1899321 RepID=A0A368K480_9HYPH|nr:SDR family NAD(P)-dependent oxidoreductase [Phyllobacterium salinisoli]RCS23445.1 SDR family NAD(P)-dependent oxidoreductase [Phyllobacterium salinisoli]